MYIRLDELVEKKEDTEKLGIRPGVHASHGMERTHVKGLLATKELIRAYIEDKFGA